MKFVLILPLLLMTCSQKRDLGTKVDRVAYSRGVALHSPIMQTTYFFPFQDTPGSLNPLEFIKNEYDTGFVMSWPSTEQRDKALFEFSVVLPIEGGAIKELLYVDLEYVPTQLQHPDSLLQFDVEYSGTVRTFIYSIDPRMVKKVVGIGPEKHAK